MKANLQLISIIITCLLCLNPCMILGSFPPVSNADLLKYPPLTKTAMLCKGLFYMMISTDSNVEDRLRWLPDPDIGKGWPTESRHIIFIRHGESEWNAIFNKGKGIQRYLYMPFRILKGLFLEVLGIFSPSSIFMDSPLSLQGMNEANAITNLFELLGSSHCGSNLSSIDPPGRNGDSPADSAAADEWAGRLHAALRSSGDSRLVLACSNLERAAETLVLALAGAPCTAGGTPRTIHVLSCLQEISRNVDAMSLAPARAAPLLKPDVLRLRGRSAAARRRGEREEDDEDEGASDSSAGLDLDGAVAFDASGNAGDRAAAAGGAGGAAARLEAFARWCFEGGRREGDVIVAAGHSNWFRCFFRAFMGRRARHPAKDRRLANAAVVALRLDRARVGAPAGVGRGGRYVYRVDESAVALLQGGYHH